MKVLLVGVGGVGEAIAIMAARHRWLEQTVLADYDVARARAVQNKLLLDGGISSRDRFPIEQLDARNSPDIVAMAKKYGVDLIMNAVDPSLNASIFDAAYESGCNYIDMALTPSVPHPESPHEKVGVMLGDYQFDRAEQWKEKGLLALVGIGVEPGMSDVFARYATDELFDSIDEISIRDGANLQVLGYTFAPTFSIWTTIEECLNPPNIWENGRGWFTTAPFSEPELFDFPDGIGQIECVNVEHEEVVLIPRYINCRRVTFKYGLGDEFIAVLRTLHQLGLDNKEKIRVKGVEVAPRDVVAACLPNPASLGDKMFGKTCAGTWVKGVKDGMPREIYLYQVADNEFTMREFGVQAVVAQTGFNPVIAMDLIQSGVWQGKGVLGPEAFDPRPFMDKMSEYGFPYAMREM